MWRSHPKMKHLYSPMLTLFAQQEILRKQLATSESPFYQHAHVANPQENCEDTKTKITRSKRLHSQNNLFPYIHLNHRQSIFCPSERDS